MSLELVTRPHRTNLVAWAKDKPEVVVLSADLTSSCEADVFRDTYPDRFFTMGMAEQNMMSVAGGMAREGLVPYLHTFAVFLTRRTFDQVALSIAYPNLKVRLVGFLPGLTTPGGVTHQATDDLALMRVLPNMNVLEAGDATEAESILDAIHDVEGPVYIRMPRGIVPRLFPKDEPLRFGQARVLSHGTDIALITSGICTAEGIAAAKALEQRGLSVHHLHVSTLKPFDDPAVRKAVTSVRLGVITAENHSVVSGLGSAVAEIMAEAGAARPLTRLGVKDVYAHGASLRYLMREYGLDARAIVDAAQGLAGKALSIPDEELSIQGLESVRDKARTEDL